MADFSAVLLHYKFTDYFYEYVIDAVNKGYHYKDSLEYRRYYEVLDKKNILKLRNNDAREFENVNELVDNDFLVVSEKFFNFINQISKKTNKENIYLRVEDIKKHKIDKNGFRKKEDVSCIVVWKDIGIERLKKCLISLKNQDYPFFEVILVDYGSKKENFVKLKNFLKKNKISYIRVKNVKFWNRSHALNIGIKRSRSKYILVSDIDMIFEKNYISECVREMKKNIYQILYTDMIDCSKGVIKKNTDVLKEYPKIKEKCNRLSDFYNNLEYRFGISICFSLSYFFKIIRGYDENYKLYAAEDDDIIKRFELMNLDIKNIKNKTSHIHQWHPKLQGVKKMKSLNSSIKKNRIYLKQNNSVIRNSNRWGEF
ncbi:glycosyltransferase [Candidatus Pacearchaeota archaeon]|nr:glycosyltransferase [Candidatus Pacearchaeota archaeon]